VCKSRRNPPSSGFIGCKNGTNANFTTQGSEKINEAEAWEELEAKKAKERLSETGGSEPGSPNLDDPNDVGRTDEKVAQKVGVSKNTYRNGKKVKEIATGQRDAPDEVVEVAKEQWEKMKEQDGQSFYGAKKQVELKEKELERKDAQERLEKAGEVGGSKGTSNLEEASTGETAEKVAQKVGVSKNTYRNGKKVSAKKSDSGDFRGCAKCH